MEELVVSLKLASRLRVRGYPLTSEWAWAPPGKLYPAGHLDEDTWKGADFLPAPTAQEIAEQLPPQIENKDNGGSYWLDVSLSLDKNGDRVWTARYDNAYHEYDITISATSMVAALAYVWLEVHRRQAL